MPDMTRRQLLKAAGAIAATTVTARLAGSAPARAASGAGHAGHAANAGPHAGPAFRGGRAVNSPKVNGFDPMRYLREFDEGSTSKMADGRTLREWAVTAVEKDIEIAPGVKYPAWTFDGQVPGPTLRCTEGERLRIRFENGTSHPHTMHFHGIHPSEMDGVSGQGDGIIRPGRSTVYEFDAEPFGMHLFHCHVGPLAEHIARGMFGTFIVDPKKGRPKADELVMIQNGYNTTFDADGNQFYAVNGIPFYYNDHPIRVKRNELVRIYLGNMLEYDPINSFHLHGNFFNYFPTGTSLTPSEFTDTIAQVQGQRGILEVRFPHAGRFMFHAHKSEFADLGWMGHFEVEN